MKFKLSFLSVFIMLVCFSLVLPSCKPKEDENAIPALLERKKVMGPADEKAGIDSNYHKAVEALKANPDDLKQYVTLAGVFVMEGRITGNSGYYGNAALKMIKKVTDNPAENVDIKFQALSLKSAIELNMHQFKDALTTAQQAVAMYSSSSGIYGALVDANVELGNYDEAVKDCDRMMTLRPDLRSYSRASYLRQIYGQNKPAIEAMQMAVDAGVPGLESTEWARTNLADLYLNTGNKDSASLLFRTSLRYRPDYPYALLGMAKVERANKNYDGAIGYARQAVQQMSEVAIVSYLGDLYELKGDAEKAKQNREDIISLLEQGQKEEAKDAMVKHNVSRELATAYMNEGQYDKALTYAQTDLNMRPNNIDANELIGWIYYLKGDYANAKTHADKMLATHTQNANTLYKAGAIYAGAGDAAKGSQMMQQALTITPYVDQKIINQAQKVSSVTMPKKM